MESILEFNGTRKGQRRVRVGSLIGKKTKLCYSNVFGGFGDQSLRG